MGRAAIPLTAALVVAGCARQEMPPGGPEDRRPPVVIQTFPEPLGVLDDLDEAVTFRFDERISERVSSGTLESAFTVSPRSGALEVSKGSRSLEVRTEDGFRPGLVYRVTMHAVVSDLFGNQMNDPFELVFTTGGDDPVPTTLAGEVWDRITGRAVADALVLAESDDGLVHQAQTGRDGIYALRYLPPGDFRVTAVEDRNRDGVADSTEVQGAARVDLVVGDTVLVDVPILAPDTSAARLTEAEALDSVTVVVTFDDYLDPELDASELEVTLAVDDTTAAADGLSPPGVERVFQEAEYADYVVMVADSFARLDSLEAAEAAAAAAAARAAEDSAAAADTAPPGDTTALATETPDTAQAALEPADTAADVGEPADTVRIGAPAQAAPGGAADQEARSVRVPPTELRPLQGESPGPTDDGRRVLPGRRIVVVLGDPLAVDVRYGVEVSGARNLVGLEGGGGEAELVREAPPPPDTAGADSAMVEDSAFVSDTGAVGGVDTVLGPGRR